MDETLARILRRFLTENEAGYDSPPYAWVEDDELTLDGKMRLEPGEASALRKVLMDG